MSMSTGHCILVLLAATTTQPASRPAPDLSRMSIDRVRSYAVGLFNRVAYLEQQLATERRTSDALRKTVADGDAKIIELQKEVARLKIVEQQYRGTPAGQKAATIEAAMLRKEPVPGMTVEQCEKMFNAKAIRQSMNGGSVVHKFNDDSGMEHYCTFDAEGKLVSWYDYRPVRPRTPMLNAFSNPDVYPK